MTHKTITKKRSDPFEGYTERSLIDMSLLLTTDSKPINNDLNNEVLN